MINKDEDVFTEIDLYIARHNAEVSKRLASGNLALPQAAIGNSETLITVKKETDCQSNDESLDSDDLEPRSKIKSSRPDITIDRLEESKNFFDSESHDSFNSSNNPDVADRSKYLNFSTKEPRYYSNKDPKPSFPESDSIYSKRQMKAIKLSDLNLKIGQPYIYKHQDH